MADTKRRITFANNYTDRASGEVYVQGKTYDVERPLARLLISIGKAAPADDAKKTSRPQPADDSATAQK